jgi:hypothetical protein
MLLRLSSAVRDHWSVSCEFEERPVRRFPQTWSLCSFQIGSDCPLLTATEEFTLLTVLLPRACTRPFGEALAELEDRVTDLLYHARFHEGLRFSGFAIAKLTDERIASHAAHLIADVQCVPGLFEALGSPQGVRSIEENINSRPINFLSRRSPRQAFIDASQGEPLRRANRRQPPPSS